MTIEHFDNLSHCPAAVRLGLEGHLENLNRGVGDPHSCGLGWENKALVAFEEGAAVGLIVYSEQEWKKTFFIEMGYVRPAFRRRGFYRALFKHLTARAREKEFRSISGTTHVENREMQETNRALGRQAAWIIYRYDVPTGDSP
jgi:ribosomal protein S18 acetylase RimI-like enzyme